MEVQSAITILDKNLFAIIGELWDEDEDYRSNIYCFDGDGIEICS